jgi:hypothetical protein
VAQVRFTPPPAQDAVELGQLLTKASAHLLAQREHGVVGDGVADARALLRAADDARLMEDAKVLGDVLLRGVQRLDELTDRSRAVAQPVQELDPHRLADDTKPLRDQLDQRLGKGAGHVHVHNYTTLEL